MILLIYVYDIYNNEIDNNDINERHNWIQNNKESSVTWYYFHCVLFIKDRTKVRFHDSRYRYVCHSTVTIFDVILLYILILLITLPYYWNWIMLCMNDSINDFKQNMKYVCVVFDRVRSTGIDLLWLLLLFAF